MRCRFKSRTGTVTQAFSSSTLYINLLHNRRVFTSHLAKVTLHDLHLKIVFMEEWKQNGAFYLDYCILIVVGGRNRSWILHIWKCASHKCEQTQTHLSAWPVKLVLEANLQNKSKMWTKAIVIILLCWEAYCGTCPQIAWSPAAAERPDQDSDGWTWTEPPQPETKSPHRTPPERPRSPGTWSVDTELWHSALLHNVHTRRDLHE